MDQGTIKYYNKYMEEKNVGKIKPDKLIRFHLGLANVQKEALMEQMYRNDSKQQSLLKTDSKRASMMNTNQVAANNFLGIYLDKITSEQKLIP